MSIPTLLHRRDRTSFAPETTNQCRRPPDKRRPRQQVISPIVVEVCSDFQDVLLVNRQLLLPS